MKDRTAASGVAFVAVGIAFMAIGAGGQRAFLALGAVFLVLGLAAYAKSHRSGGQA